MRKDGLFAIYLPAPETYPLILKFFVICFTCFIASGLAIGNINDDLIAYWNFNEGQGTQVLDSSGMGNIGTIYGATWINGIAGKALGFDGVNDYINVANTSSQQITTNQLSISMWFNLQQDIGNTQSRLICKQQDWNRSWGLEFFGKDYLGSAGNQLAFHDSNGTTDFICYTGKLIETGIWHHVGVVDNGGTIDLYLDGQIFYTTNQGRGIPSSIPAPIRIGRTNPTSTYFFNGFMDEIRLYDRALSGEEMEELYLIPEPATIILAGFGFLSISLRKRS